MDASDQDVNRAQMLPPQCYVSDEFFQFEKDTIFQREWLCVGRESWASKPGDFFTSTYVGEPIVIVRGGDGVLRAMSNVCQHRAMLVAEGRGNARALKCQYHHWSYALDGQLIGAPDMERAVDFDKRCIRLPAIKLETWLGFVFVNFDAEAAPLSPRLEILANALRNYNLDTAESGPAADTVRFPWNWKVTFENSNDGYHANKLHFGPLHNVVPSELCSFPELPNDSAAYFRFNGTTHKDAALNPTHRAMNPIFPNLTDEERSRFIFANLPPTLFLSAMADQVNYFIIQPISVNEVAMTRGWIVPPGTTSEPLFKERIAISAASVKEIAAQDLFVDERVQAGLGSRFAARGRFSWQEQCQREFNRWLVPRYQAGWNEVREGSAARA